jgi:hypothetical protein
VAEEVTGVRLSGRVQIVPSLIDRAYQNGRTGNCRNRAITRKTPGSGSMTAIAIERQLSSLFRQQAAGRRCRHRRTNTKLLGAIVARADGPSFLLILLRRVPALVSLLVGETGRGVSFVTAQTEGERLVHPRGRWLASLLYRLQPFRKERWERWGTLRLYAIQEFSPAPENSPAQAKRA